MANFICSKTGLGCPYSSLDCFLLRDKSVKVYPNPYLVAGFEL